MALREIRRYQKTADLLISRAPFSRLVREVHDECARAINKTYGRQTHVACRWSPQAVEAVQEAAEAYLTRLFTDSVLAAVHAKRVTISHKDMLLCRRLQGERDKDLPPPPQ